MLHTHTRESQKISKRGQHEGDEICAHVTNQLDDSIKLRMSAGIFWLFGFIWQENYLQGAAQVVYNMLAIDADRKPK